MVEEEVKEQEQEQEESGEQQAPPPQQVDLETEKRAKMMGWVPKESFRGDPERWQPAEKFVARAEELMPIMKTQLRRYEDQISSLRDELDSGRKTMDRIVKVAEKVEQQGYERAKAELTRKQVEAVAAGDTQTWMNLEQEKDKLERPEKIQVEKSSGTPNEENPMFKTWHTDNDWYLNDGDLTLYANAFAQSNPPNGVPYTQWLESIGSAVKRAFPHKFDNPARKSPASVDGGANRGGGLGRPKNKTYNDLPADAKAHCDKLVANVPNYTKEKYVKDYFEGE